MTPERVTEIELHVSDPNLHYIPATLVLECTSEIKRLSNAITRRIKPIEIPHGQHVGRLVSTPDGVGVLVGIETPFNGAYVEPSRCSYIVWYGVDNAQNGFVSRRYENAVDISPLSQPQD